LDGQEHMASKDQKPNSLFQRLSKLFKSGPVVKRKIRTLDTTIAMADKSKSSGALLFQKSLAPTYATITANAYNLSERLMRYQDFQEMEYSLAISTKIATPDGFKTIGELTEECEKDPNKTFVVYSYDHVQKKIVPALGKQARQTCVDHAWKVKFDNGKEIIASPEHRLMLRDGTYRKVEDLQPGNSMMPFYRKDLFEGAKEGTRGYSWIYTMDDRFRGWSKEHQMVAEWIAGRNLAEDEVVHHINFVKTDNRPENLKIMSKSDHDSYHTALNNNVKWSPENGEWIEEFKKRHSAWMRDNAPTARTDVTFSRILEAAERVGFSMPAIASTLDVTWNLIYSRLTAHGFASFKQFVEAYRDGQKDSLIDGRPGLLTRDLTLDMIRSVVLPEDTKRSLAIKLGCTTNVLDKFLAKRERMTWTQLRSSLGYNDQGSTGFSNLLRRGGRPKEKNNHEITFQQICNAYVPGQTLPRLASSLGVNKNTVISRLAQQGHKRYSEFASAYQNCKVESVEYMGVIPLYDLTVDGYKNFATDSVMSHNTPELAAALDIYADETCAQDEKGRVLHIYSDNEKVKDILEDLFYNTLNVEFNLRSWARNLVKYGDFFLYNDVSPEYGVINAFPIPVNEIEREENYDPNDPFAVRYRWVTLGNRTLENWEVTHFRLLGNDMFLPYGSSVIEAARRIWRQLILIEDAMLVYRVVRAPERRVFYIDVANIPPENVPMYVEEQRKNLRTNQVVDRQTGRLDLRYAPLSIEDDYFIPVRGGDSGTKIDTLAGGQNAAAVEDVAYIQKKLFAALKIPRAYLGYDEMLSSKATLAQEDIRFSRTINVIQKVLLAELNKLAIIHLYSNGFDGEDLQNFTLHLSNPSTVAQQQKLELWRSKFEIGGSLPEGMGSKEFVRKTIWGLNDEQCEALDDQRYKEKIVDAAIENAKPEEGEGGEEGGGEEEGGGDLFGGGEEEGGGEESGGEEETGGGEEEGGGDLFAGDDVGEKEPDVELLTSSDEPDIDMPLYEKDKVPVKAQSQLKKAIYDSSRRKKHNLHQPDFVKMTSHKDTKDPYDIKASNREMRGDPFKESPSPRFKTSLPSDVSSALRRMTLKLGPRPQQSDGLLVEEKNINNEIEGLFITDED